jgi:hypothetical protein
VGDPAGEVSEPFIDLAGVQKTYRMGRLDYPALRGIDLEIGAGELVETLTLAAAGWLIGVPLGYLLDRFLVWLLNTVLNLDITPAFPPWNLALTLAGTILLAVLITLVPIRRATRRRHGHALRYA